MVVTVTIDLRMVISTVSVFTPALNLKSISLSSVQPAEEDDGSWYSVD